MKLDYARGPLSKFQEISVQDFPLMTTLNVLPQQLHRNTYGAHRRKLTSCLVISIFIFICLYNPVGPQQTITPGHTHL